MLIVVSSAGLLAAWALLLLQVDPVPTWFYVFAWYPTMVLLDAVAKRLDGRPTMLWRRPMIYVFLWSPAVWFCFEVANFRLNNWYYVFLPHAAWERWCGIVLSFATVVPAVLLAERVLDAASVFRNGRGPVLTMRRGGTGWAVGAGLGMGMLSLAFPRLFFPLIWGAVFLVVDPLVFRHRPSLSLLADLTRGYWGRIGRLMLGGLGIGLLWETYNFWARGKWIYTGPWLEELKLFEMPPFGFVGFPVFALEGWSMYAGLCVLGLAAPMTGTSTVKGGRLAPGLALGIVFCAATLVGMERYTISSTAPLLAELPGMTTEATRSLRAAGVRTTSDLAEADPDELVFSARIKRDAAVAGVQAARLATLRGIGDQHASTLIEIGVRTVCELREQHPETLAERLRSGGGRARPSAAEVRVWIRAARRACQGS